QRTHRRLKRSSRRGSGDDGVADDGGEDDDGGRAGAAPRERELAGARRARRRPADRWIHGFDPERAERPTSATHPRNPSTSMKRALAPRGIPRLARGARDVTVGAVARLERREPQVPYLSAGMSTLSRGGAGGLLAAAAALSACHQSSEGGAEPPALAGAREEAAPGEPAPARSVVSGEPSAPASDARV